jgi:hypothetical protein
LTQTFTKAEQAKSTCAATHSNFIRVKAHAVVFNADNDLILNTVNGNVHMLGLTVFNHIGQQLAHAAEQQGLHILRQGFALHLGCGHIIPSIYRTILLINKSPSELKDCSAFPG